jgi:hypothetical protein
VSALLQSAPKDPGTSAVLVTTGTATPAYWYNGLPYTGGELAVDDSTAIDHYHQGVGFTAVGRLCITTGAPVYFTSGAAPMNAGRLCMSGGAAVNYTSGVAYNSDGTVFAEGLVPTAPSSPTNLTAVQA